MRVLCNPFTRMDKQSSQQRSPNAVYMCTSYRDTDKKDSENWEFA